MTIDEMNAKYGKPVGATQNSNPFGFTQPKDNTNLLFKGIGSGIGKDYTNSVSNALKSGVDQVTTGYNEAKNAVDSGFSGNNLLKLLEGSVKMGAGVVGSVFSSLAPVSDVIGAGVKAVSEPISNIPTVQKFAETKTGQNVARGAEDITNLSTLAGGVVGVMDIAPKVIPTIKNLATKTSDVVTSSIDKIKTPSLMNEVKITDLYNRAIKPTVVGKSNAGQVQKTNLNVLSGIKTIADNKTNLSFTDASGENIVGQTPKSVDQLNQAITQTKASIFKQYDALAKQAGDAGVTINGSNIGKELQPVVESKSLAIANPKAVEYAKAMQDRLTNGGAIDAQTAQDVVQHFNEMLKSFYKNPTYDNATNVSIDALVANKFREALDSQISNATGSEYQSLKNSYGALSSMEKDVTHRNIVWGRQNNIGFASNIANIASGAELVKGLIRMNPTDIAISGGIKLMQKYMKYLNNPDVGVTKIFSEIEKPSLPSTENTSGLVKSKQVIQSSPKSTTSNLKVKSKK